MKKFFTILFAGALMLTGCGNNGGAKGKAPSFLGYSIETGMTAANHSNENQKRVLKAYDAGENTIGEVITDSMFANKGEKLVITLQFVNEDRDNFVDLVLNDSDYGNDQVYEISSKTNIVHSVETTKSGGKWITNITLLMPKTRSNTSRTIEITEVNFLKATINKQIHADLDKDSFSKKLDAIITNKYVPTSKIYFEYEEVEYEGNEGLEITKIKDDYGYPNCVYIPASIDGIPVISTSNIVVLDECLDNLVLPETFKYHNGRILNACVNGDFVILSHHIKNVSKTEIDPSLVGFIQKNDIYLWEDYYNSIEGYSWIDGYLEPSDYEGDWWWQLNWIYIDTLSEFPVL